MRVLPTTENTRLMLLICFSVILLALPYEWIFVSIVHGRPQAMIIAFLGRLGSTLLELAWVGGFIVGGAALAAVAVGREGLSKCYRRRARVLLVATSVLFAINCIFSVEFGNDDDLSLLFHSGGAILSIGTPPDQPTWIIPYGRVFFDLPPDGISVGLAPRFSSNLYCYSLNFVYMKSTYVSIWPAWAITIGLSTGALWRKKRFLAEECQSCGYNLTGNVSGICPECSAALPTSGKGELSFR